MRKRTILFLAAILTLSMVQGAAAHDKVTHANWGTPVVDGKMDDVWKNAEKIHVADEAITDAGDQTAVADVYSLWDGDFIYFYAVITDPTVDAELKDDAWNQDCIGFMIDYAYHRVEGESYRDLGDDAYAGYVNVPAVEGEANQPEVPSIFGIQEYADGVESMCVCTKTGWEVEIAIPLLYKDYQPGDKIGYEICLNNSIGEGSRYAQTVWSYANGDNGSDSWQYAYNMGTLIFNERPAEPEAVIVETTEIPQPTETAPKTADATTLLLLSSTATALSAVLLRKRKH